MTGSIKRSLHVVLCRCSRLTSGSCLRRVAELFRFDGELSQEISREVDSCLQRVAELLLSILELESEPLSCDMYKALNNVRIMPRASHRGTGKRRVNQVNENSKLKSEVYEMRRLYVQKKEKR